MYGYVRFSFYLQIYTTLKLCKTDSIIIVFAYCMFVCCLWLFLVFCVVFFLIKL